MAISRFNVFKGKTVLVTGHTGFKGSWLSLWLYKLGAKVIGYALDPEHEEGIYLRARVAAGLIDYRHDIRDYPKLLSIIKKHKPEIVFHFAAQALVRESYTTPKETFDVNVGGTVNILEACRLSPSVKVLVPVTSDKCYENTEEGRPFCEKDRLGGFDPYSSSKACAELVVAAYIHSFFIKKGNGNHLGVASVRAGNVIGGGDWAKDRVVPDSIRALRAGRPIKIRNPLHTRPWQHVLDPLAGYLLLAAKLSADPGKYSGAWNFGPEPKTIVRVAELVERIIKAYGRGSWEMESITDQPNESALLVLDATKAMEHLRWRPILTLDQAVETTVAWYKVAEEKHDLNAFSITQINEYMERMD